MFWSVLVLLVLLIPILAIVLDSQLGRALAQRLEQGRIGGGDDLMAERVAFLEGEVDRLNSEISKLQEESDFLHKLLTERSSASEGPSGASDAAERLDALERPADTPATPPEGERGA